MDATDAALVGLVGDLFRHPRPAKMTGDCRCDECEEHEETLQGLTPETVSLAELGSAAWDPVCMANAEAYRYFLPGLVRLALAGHGEEYYLDQFLFHLESRERLFRDAQERAAIRSVLERLLVTHLDEASSTLDIHVLGRLLDAFAPPG
ncbi:MAG: hypothetical protein ACKVVT_03965 [Dehalococcoidia bacterium]